MDAITDDDEDTIPSSDSDTADASCKTNDDIAASIHMSLGKLLLFHQ
jgi:hypothetical protein